MNAIMNPVVLKIFETKYLNRFVDGCTVAHHVQGWGFQSFPVSFANRAFCCSRWNDVIACREHHPSCVESCVRKLFPSPFYMGFKRKRKEVDNDAVDSNSNKIEGVKWIKTEGRSRNKKGDEVEKLINAKQSSSWKKAKYLNLIRVIIRTHVSVYI